jgi:hypothetical protein
MSSRDRRLSRRQALRRLAGLAAVVSPVAGRLGAAEARAAGPPLTGCVVGPLDSNYDTARLDYNWRFDVRPLAIVYWRDALDVSNAVRFAQSIPASLP